MKSLWIIAASAIIALAVALGIYVPRYQGHMQTVHNLEGVVARATRWIDVYRSDIDRMSPDVDAYNHASQALDDTIDSMSSIADLDTLALRIKHFDLERGKLDRDINRFDALNGQALRDLGETESKPFRGEIEAYHRESDNLADTFDSSVHFLTIAESNPLVMGDSAADGQSAGREFGSKLRSAIARYLHALQTLVTDEVTFAERLTKNRDANAALLREEKAVPFWEYGTGKNITFYYPRI